MNIVGEYNSDAKVVAATITSDTHNRKELK